MPNGPFIAARVPRRIRPPAGDYYFCVESPRGNFGMYIASDGSDIPFRLKLRTPSFSHISTMPAVMPGTLLADAVAILGSIDIVVPEIDR